MYPTHYIDIYNISTEGDFECCEAIDLYLDTVSNKLNNDASSKIMYDTIKKYYHVDIPSMAIFTLYINEKYNLNYTLLNDSGGYNLHFYILGKDMYKVILRDFKLNQLIKND